jgi:hypothetical protein
VLATKGDIQALHTDVLAAIEHQTRTLAATVLAGMGFVVAALRLIP